MSDRDLSGLKRKHYLIHLGAESFRIRTLFEGLKAIHVKNILGARSPLIPPLTTMPAVKAMWFVVAAAHEKVTWRG